MGDVIIVDHDVGRCPHCHSCNNDLLNDVETSHFFVYCNDCESVTWPFFTAIEARNEWIRLQGKDLFMGDDLDFTVDQRVIDRLAVVYDKMANVRHLTFGNFVDDFVANAKKDKKLSIWQLLEKLEDEFEVKNESKWG